ncbi:unnamed protein product, partial [Polarella glacialis]
AAAPPPRSAGSSWAAIAAAGSGSKAPPSPTSAQGLRGPGPWPKASFAAALFYAPSAVGSGVGPPLPVEVSAAGEASSLIAPISGGLGSPRNRNDESQLPVVPPRVASVPLVAAPPRFVDSFAASSLASPSTGSAERAPVKLWVSGIPTEETKGMGVRNNPVRAVEVKDALNACLRENAPHIAGEVVEVDRKDDRKPFAFVLVGDEKTARELLMLSKAKKVFLRGEPLVLDLSNYNTARVETLYSGGRSRDSRNEDQPRGDRRDSWGSGRGKGGGKRDDGGRWPEKDRGGKGKGGKGRETESKADSAENWRQR